MSNIIPIRDLKNTSAISEISDMCHKTEEPIYVTKNGYGDMVIMSMETYEEKMALLDVYEKLMVAEEDCKYGYTVDAKESLKKLREKYGV